jgi:hypothetical protein
MSCDSSAKYLALKWLAGALFLEVSSYSFRSHVQTHPRGSRAFLPGSKVTIARSYLDLSTWATEILTASIIDKRRAEIYCVYSLIQSFYSYRKASLYHICRATVIKSPYTALKHSVILVISCVKLARERQKIGVDATRHTLLTSRVLFLFN